MNVQPSKETAISKELAAQQAALNTLEERLKELQERLAPVLRVLGPNPQADAPTPPDIPLALSLRERTTRIRSASDTLADLLERLEL